MHFQQGSGVFNHQGPLNFHCRRVCRRKEDHTTKLCEKIKRFLMLYQVVPQAFYSWGVSINEGLLSGPIYLACGGSPIENASIGCTQKHDRNRPFIYFRAFEAMKNSYCGFCKAHFGIT